MDSINAEAKALHKVYVQYYKDYFEISNVSLDWDDCSEETRELFRLMALSSLERREEYFNAKLNKAVNTAVDKVLKERLTQSVTRLTPDRNNTLFKAKN